MNTQTQFEQHIRKTKTCWLWTAGLSDNGYGQLRWHGKRRYAHQVSWEIYVGPIPQGKQILHKSCDVKYCIRPTHLYAETRLNNAHDFMERLWHKHNTRKLTPDDVRKIRELAKTMKTSSIARLYPQMEYKAIRRVVTGEYWRHVK